MSDTVFRSASPSETTTEANQAPAGNDKPQEPVKTDGEAKHEILPPFTEYAKVNGHPYLAEYYDMRNHWDDPDGGYKEDIDLINGYFDELVKYGELDNSVEAIKEKIRSFERVCNLKQSDRIAVKLPKTAAYVKFLIAARENDRQKRRWSSGQ